MIFVLFLNIIIASEAIIGSVVPTQFPVIPVVGQPTEIELEALIAANQTYNLVMQRGQKGITDQHANGPFTPKETNSVTTVCVMSADEQEPLSEACRAMNTFLTRLLDILKKTDIPADILNKLKVMIKERLTFFEGCTETTVQNWQRELNANLSLVEAKSQIQDLSKKTQN